MKMGRRLKLHCGSILALVAASPALAQAQPVAPATPADLAAPTDATDATIVVTGTLFHRTNSETASPVSVITADELKARGINTVADALQTLSVNNAGALPTAFSANGAFANGASGASLRGLTTSSTLVLFDGLRAAYYPLADDGQRNFVDLSTIPDAIVERVEVLRDGASSTYGADAVAGVVNIITRKEIKGFEGTAENGISQRGDAAERRLSLTYGFGDLAKQRFNIYFNAEYQKDDALLNSSRGFPFNTANLSRLSAVDDSGTRVYGTNGVVNGIQGDGSYQGSFLGVGATIVPVVRPATPDGTPIPGSAYQLLNPAAGCRGLPSVNVPVGAGPDPTAIYGTQCQQDLVNQYGVIQPSSERLGGTVHGSLDIGSRAHAYAIFTYYQDRVSYQDTPASIQQQTNSGDFSTYNIVLPPTLTNGQLNPNNPFAASGQSAELFYRFGDIPRSTSSLSRTYRGAIGVNGSFGHDWNYAADFTGMSSDLTTTQVGVPYFANVLSVIADGSYNFLNPAANSAAVRAFVAPTNVSAAHSTLYQGQASLTKSLFTLPGGPLQVAVGGSVRYESINDPSANPPNPQPDPSQQYFPLINGFGAVGHRYVESGYFEIEAPIFTVLEVNGGGRYDNYSTGFSRFSPKIGVKFTPIKELALRGTFSKGFRTPSFAETGALPTTGFVTVTPGGANATAFSAAHNADAYSQPYGLGLTTAGNPNLKPEISTNVTAGIVAQPLSWLSVTADYYNIAKKNVIVGADYSTAVAAYYAGQPIPTGFVVTPDIVDAAAPGAQRRIFNITYGYINANSLVTDGIDFGLQAKLHLPHDIAFSSSGEATYILRNNETFPGANGNTVQRYAGTLGPFVVTSASGTPRWRANWSNSFNLGAVTLTGTAYYTSGYRGTADDYSGAGSASSCSNAVGTYRSGASTGTPLALQCDVKAFVDVDLTGAVKVTEHVGLTLNVLNVFNVKPPFDPNTYGGNNYNPAWAEAGIVGRYFRVGVNAKF